jgi:type I restriction enzyme S subunit
MTWVRTKIGDVITLQRGHDLPSSIRIPGDIPVISSSGITDYHNASKARGEGVVTGRYGTLGQVFYVNGRYWPLNTTLYVKDFKGNDPKFIYYFLQTLGLERFNGAAAVPGLDRNVIHRIDVQFNFHVPIQKKIASILSAYDELIENNTQRIGLLEEMAEEIYKEWFVRMRFPGHEQCRWYDKEGNEVEKGTDGGLPEGWTRQLLGKHLKYFRGKSYSSEELRDDNGIEVGDLGEMG